VLAPNSTLEHLPADSGVAFTKDTAAIRGEHGDEPAWNYPSIVWERFRIFASDE
jgi:hypothetical protein